MTKVLIVDDEKYVRMGIKEETDWSLIDCEVVGEASNGEEGLKIALEKRPDLVISDIRMPKMDGIAFAENLRDNLPNTKVIFLTAYDEFEYARRAIRLGISDYILKPFKDGELEASVQRLLHLYPDAPTPAKELEDKLIPLKDKKSISNRYVLADSMGVSEGHISRLFKSEIEVGINNYLTRYRIRKAMDYLKDVQVKVYEVTEMCGYQDIAYFSNTFKKLVGKSPSDYQTNGLE